MNRIDIVMTIRRSRSWHHETMNLMMISMTIRMALRHRLVSQVQSWWQHDSSNIIDKLPFMETKKWEPQHDEELLQALLITIIEQLIIRWI
jgi:hypothetical protein